MNLLFRNYQSIIISDNVLVLEFMIDMHLLWEFVLLHSGCVGYLSL